jgi:hypothetical protein
MHLPYMALYSLISKISTVRSDAKVLKKPRIVFLFKKEYLAMRMHLDGSGKWWRYTVLTSLEHFAAAVASLSMGRVRPGIVSCRREQKRKGKEKVYANSFVFKVSSHRELFDVDDDAHAPSPHRTDHTLGARIARAQPLVSSTKRVSLTRACVHVHVHVHAPCSSLPFITTLFVMLNSRAHTAFHFTALRRPCCRERAGDDRVACTKAIAPHEPQWRGHELWIEG